MTFENLVLHSNCAVKIQFKGEQIKAVSKIEEVSNYVKKTLQAKWVKWVHHATKPAESSEEKSANVIKGIISKHCAICLNLNGCCFVKDKCPTKPLHPNCHCDTINIYPITATIESPIAKFTKYVFVSSAVDDKKQLFELWGYGIMDSEYLQQEFIKQATLAYSVGDYELGLLNEYGQRINITITLKRKNKNEYVTFRSGWMVYPNGKIVLITPYGRR